MIRTYVDVVAAEARAVEEGHVARYDAASGTFRVTSDDNARFEYVLRVRADVLADGAFRLRVDCDCRSGLYRGNDPVVGVVCKHGALVARRLERLRWVRWEASRHCWLLTERAVGAITRRAR